MGKKAVKLLLHTILIIFTVIIVVLTGLAIMGGYTSPRENGFMALMALGMPGLMITNLLLLIYWIIRKRWWFVLPLAAMAANYKYFPRTFQLGPKDPVVLSTSPNAIRIATYNINYFGHEDLPQTVTNIARLLKQHQIDAVCFQEFAEQETFNADSIAARLGMDYHMLGRNSVGYHGIAIFSRFPMYNAHRIIFKESPNSAMWVDMDVNGNRVRLINAHLQTTSVNWEKDDLERQIALGTTTDQARAAIRISNIMKTNFRRRSYQAEQIAHLMDTTSIPVIYAGDTNDTPSSYVYNTLTGSGKRIDGFEDAGRGYAYTFHSMRRLLRIDYILYSPHLRGIEYLSPHVEWSDHNPVIMHLELL